MSVTTRTTTALLVAIALLVSTLAPAMAGDASPPPADGHSPTTGGPGLTDPIPSTASVAGDPTVVAPARAIVATERAIAAREHAIVARESATAAVDAALRRVRARVQDRLGCRVAMPPLPPPARDLLPRPSCPDSGFAHFVTRDGDRLLDGDTELRFLSVNNSSTLLAPNDYAFGPRDALVRLPSDDELEDIVRTVDAWGGQVLRTYVVPSRKAGDADPLKRLNHVVVDGDDVQLVEASMERLDKLLAVANEHGVRLIVPLVGTGPTLHGTFRDYADQPDGLDFFDVGSPANQRFKAMIGQLMDRVNTHTGVRYRDDKAILAWETGNEFRPEQGPATDAWTRDIAAYLKQHAPDHLVMDGRMPKHRNEITEAVIADPNVDIFSVHSYNAPDYLGMWEDLQGRKALVYGELGMVDAATVRRVFGTIIDRGINGGLYWAFKNHNRDGGFYHHLVREDLHWPGFAQAATEVPQLAADLADEQEIVDAIAELAYAIQGRERPPLAVPDPPVLLPIDHVGDITWRGSVGARSYLVERATSPDGPWAVLAPTVYPNLVGFQPLLTDTYARVGDTYHYRVRARNESGLSAPSNVVGPVEVTRLQLTDELFDISQAAFVSANLRIDHGYGSRTQYANDHAVLRRTDTGLGQIVHQLPAGGQARQVTVYSYELPGGQDLVVQAQRPDGSGIYDTLPAAVVKHELTELPNGQPVVRARYVAEVPAGRSRIKVLTNDRTTTAWPAIGRIEIVYDGEVDLTPATPVMHPTESVFLLGWDEASRAVTYELQRADADADLADATAWTTVATDLTVADVPFHDATAIVGEAYRYRVVAVNPAARSAPSDPVGPIVAEAVPPPPPAPELTLTGPYGIRWDADARFVGFELERRPPDGDWEVVLTAAGDDRGPVRDRTVVAGDTYHYRLVGIDGQDRRVASAEAGPFTVANVAPTATLTADSTRDGFSLANIVDGVLIDDRSRWLSGDTTREHFVELAFERPQPLSAFRLWSGVQSGPGWQIADLTVSVRIADGWREVAAVVDNPQDGYLGRHLELTFEQVTTDAVRIDITNPTNNGGNIARIYEVELGLPDG